MSIQISFETHSTTEDSEAGIATGWLPGRLSTTGREQAAALGRRRRDSGLTAVYSSDLARAIETATLAFAGSDIPLHVDVRLHECNYGELNGGRSGLVAAERLGRIDRPFHGGQSYQQVVEGVRTFLSELLPRNHHAHVLLIGHSATLWSLQHLLEGRPLPELLSHPIAWQPGWEFELADGWRVSPTPAEQQVATGGA